ncbi:GldG family protein [Pseudoflavonifractor phocaeensis]|uniref:GldG family protein n=1 Tax=Pseudoflavonifractor phocaeensis TaxID=1870988 RepID=UPI00195A0849|nr:GldG family protein [Pseudoflavonifractor phocaeensis]MBM6926786.1 GldG family protein [Pseudoflavonifractor phocaeensis]
MKKPELSARKAGGGKGKLAFRGGAYSLAITAIVLALLVVVNVLAGVLPAAWTKYDISASQLYSVTSNTKVVLNALEEDVTIYWIVQADQEDVVLETLLSKYESLSDHVKVEKKNPDVYPTFAQQYTDETVENNSLIVVCGDRSRYIPIDDIYLYEVDMYTYTSYLDSFDGEGAITSAIDYVVTEDLPQVYQLEGHGEAELPATFQEQLEKGNVELQSLSLLTVDQIPEDAACLLIYAPASDISTEERDMLADYVAQGGKLLVMAGPVEDASLDNLNSLLTDYGVTVNEGIVVEGDREHYALQSPLALMPDMSSNDITDPLIEERYYPILTIANGLTIGEEAGEGTVTALLTTSDAAFSKVAGYEMTSYAQEDGDIAGPFVLGVSIAHDSGGGIVWFTSGTFLDDGYNAYSSGANVNLAMNALSSLIGEREAMAIRSKSLDYNYLTISDSTASLLQVTMIGLFPLLFLGAGIFVVVRRRRMQHEPV